MELDTIVVGDCLNRKGNGVELIKTTCGVNKWVSWSLCISEI